MFYKKKKILFVRKTFIHQNAFTKSIHNSKLKKKSSFLEMPLWHLKCMNERGDIQWLINGKY